MPKPAPPAPAGLSDAAIELWKKAHSLRDFDEAGRGQLEYLCRVYDHQAKLAAQVEREPLFGRTAVGAKVCVNARLLERVRLLDQLARVLRQLRLGSLLPPDLIPTMPERR